MVNITTGAQRLLVRQPPVGAELGGHREERWEGGHESFEHTTSVLA